MVEERKDKLARTMRIDIAPDTLQDSDSDRTKAKPARIITKKSKRVTKIKSRPGFPSSSDTGETGGAPAAGAPATAKPSDKDFQELLQSIYDAAIITDMNGSIVNANGRAATFFRFSIEELRELTVLDLISGSDASLITTICQNLVERFVLIEACYCSRKDDSYFPAEIAVNQMKLTGSDHLCFFVRDITLRRQAEEQLRIEHNAVQNSRSGIVISDLDNNIQYVNPAVCSMWGYAEASDLSGKNIGELWADGAVEDDFVEAITQSEETWIREIAATKGDGSEFEVQVTAAANSNSDGELVGLVFSFVNISDRKRAEQAEREAERQRVMLESLGAACHHLGQPATVLLANLGIMQSRAPAEESDMTDLISACVDAAESLSDTLHRLNAINEYRTTPYLDDGEGSEGTRILEI